MISKMTEQCILCGDNQIPTEKSVQHRNDFKDQRTLHSLSGHSNPNWKTQIIIQMITKMTDHDILCWRNQISIERSLHILLGHSNSNWKKNSSLSKWLQRWQNLTSFGGHPNYNWKKNSPVLKWFQRWQTPTSFVGTFKIQLKKTIQYRKGLKDRKILHPLWGHSNPNWKRQFIIEIITKMTEPYILCGDIQIPTEKDSSIFKWFQIWTNLTSFLGTFKFQLKKRVQYWNDYKDDRTLHSLWGHSNSNWNNSSVSKWFQRSQNLHPLWGHSSFNWKEKQFSIEMISKMTEPCILCGDIHVPNEKSVHHRNDLNYQRTLHPLWGHSNPNWKTQIIIEMITKMTDPYLLCWDIQVSNERSLHLSLGHLKSNWKKQFSILMISKMTEPYINCGDTQIPYEKDTSALTWFQRSQSFTSFAGRFRSQLRKTVQYWNDLKDYRTLHPLRGDSDPN